MTNRVYNFSGGPAMLPIPVMETVQKEFLDFHGLGASIVEISHRLPVFIDIIETTKSLFRELTGLPNNYKVLFMHGGAQMQFSAVPLNLMSMKSHKGSYFITGRWGTLAENEARKYGNTEILIDGKEFEYRQIPQYDTSSLDQGSSYAHMTTNNTLYGTRWNQFPDTGNVTLVADATSDILSREMDYSQFGIVYAGLQKNLGTSGTGLVVVREDLLGHALPETPKLLDYALFDEHNSLPNTINVFAVYVMCLVLEWVKEVEKRGAGEILLQSVDSDGRRRGFDIELAKEVVSLVKIPVVVSSGAGSLEDIKPYLNINERQASNE